MINLLPPPVKTSIKFSRYNVAVLRYTLLLVVIGGAIGVTMQFTGRTAGQQITAAEHQLAATQAEIKQLEPVERNVDILEEKLQLTEQLLAARSRYSQLLNDLARVIPAGAYITNVALEGDASEPVEITMSVASQQQAAVVRSALASSPRLAHVDIQGFSFSEDSGRFTLNLVAAYTPGAAR